MIFLVGVYGFLVEPQAVEINHIRVPAGEKWEALFGKTVCQLSDLHSGEIGPREKRVLELLKDLKPDFLFLTGDYVKWKSGYGAALNLLSSLDAACGVFAVMGDHDYSDSRKSCLFCHQAGSGAPTGKHKAVFLRNRVERIQLDRGGVWIGGLGVENGDPDQLKEAVAYSRGKEPLIILSHTPLNFDLLDESQDVLMLAGDTHGGQVPLPSWLWRILGYEKNAKYPQGLFEQGRKRLFVSRGIGTSHLPFRLFRRPEIVVFHFE